MNPAATQAVQNNYYGTPVPLQETAAARTVVVLGAGVDAAVGFPTSCSLAPKITEWLETDEGKAVDMALRKRLKGLRFSYAKFVDDAIERLAHDLDRERETICSRVSRELEQNDRLDEGLRKMGRLIVRLFRKLTEVKAGAAIDEETEDCFAETICPIISEGDAIGAVALFSREPKTRMGETEQKLALSAANFLGRQMEQ